MDLNDALIRAKERVAGRGGLPGAASASDRLPPGQTLTRTFPEMRIALDRPEIAREQWKLEVAGAMQAPLTLDWAAWQALPRVDQTSDFHCVTRWSKLDVAWGGVRWIDFLKQVQPAPEARHVIFSSYDGYTTNIPLTELDRADVLLADTLDGEPLTAEHGGPVRLVVPHLYGWKSAKYLSKIGLVARDAPGFWETRGYHNHADPWREERYS